MWGFWVVERVLYFFGKRLSFCFQLESSIIGASTTARSAEFDRACERRRSVIGARRVVPLYCPY